MNKLLKTFLAKEDGVVTVDWIVLTAAITFMCLSAIGALQTSVNNLAEALSGEVSKKEVVSLSD